MAEEYRGKQSRNWAKHATKQNTMGGLREIATAHSRKEDADQYGVSIRRRRSYLLSEWDCARYDRPAVTPKRLGDDQ